MPGRAKRIHLAPAFAGISLISGDEFTQTNKTDGQQQYNACRDIKITQERLWLHTRTPLTERGKRKPAFDFLLRSMSSAAGAKQPYLILFANGLSCHIQKTWLSKPVLRKLFVKIYPLVYAAGIRVRLLLVGEFASKKHFVG